MTEKIIANFTLNENEGLRANFKLKEQEIINAILKISPNITEHDKLSGRNLSNQHPISAITGLETALNNYATKDYVDGLVGNIETALNNINSGG